MEKGNENSKPVKTLLITGLIVFFILFISVLTIFTSHQASTIDPDQKSKDRLSTLNKILTDTFGTVWPGTLILIIVLLSVILFIVHAKIKQNIEISSTFSNVTFKLLIAFVALFSILIICLGVNVIIKSRQNPALIPNTISERQQEKQRKLIVMITGLTLFGIFAIIFTGHYLWTVFHKNKK
jgi:choline-glycine betaine transporter